MKLNVEEYDFKLAKRRNSSSKAYNRVASYFAPVELLFLKDFIMQRNYSINIDITEEEENDAYNIDTRPYYDYDDFYEKHEIECKYLRDLFWEWAKENRVSYGGKKDTKSFNNKMVSLNLHHFEKMLHSVTRRAVFVFKPSDLLFELIDKKYVDADVKNWRKDNKKKKKVEISDELLGF